MPVVHINGVVVFAPNLGVLAKEGLLNYSPEEIKNMLETAYAHVQDDLLVEACCGGRGPFVDYWEMSLEEYLELKKEFELEIQIANVTRDAKKKNTQIRRSEYNSRRPQLVLQMIEVGLPYVCAEEGCTAHNELTIDHIVPLSKGGSDELSNLQFMCGSHNSSKGDKTSAN